MSETKFTPGPWDSDIGSMETFVVKAADGSLVAWVNYRSEDDDTDDRAMQEANATLMAAAPDLYDALIDVLKVIADENYSDESYAAFQKAQAARAKALGEA